MTSSLSNQPYRTPPVAAWVLPVSWVLAKTGVDAELSTLYAAKTSPPTAVKLKLNVYHPLVLNSVGPAVASVPKPRSQPPALDVRANELSDK